MAAAVLSSKWNVRVYMWGRTPHAHLCFADQNIGVLFAFNLDFEHAKNVKVVEIYLRQFRRPSPTVFLLIYCNHEKLSRREALIDQ